MLLGPDGDMSWKSDSDELFDIQAEFADLKGNRSP
jgi:hypothetical protein